MDYRRCAQMRNVGTRAVLRSVTPTLQGERAHFPFGRTRGHGRPMLGSGRDFLTALVDPHRVPADAEIARMEVEINARTDLVRVSGLRRVDAKYMDHLKEGEENKRKVYRCVVWTSKSISAENLSELDQKNPFVLNQETPIRVMHRRSLMTRPRSIYKMKTERINEHVFLLDVETQAGTYVKEFVHGDRGRT
eukprot:1096570_1